MLAGLDHLNIVARDISALKPFYEHVLGLGIVSEFDISEAGLSTGLGVPGAELRVVFWEIPGSTTQIEMVQYLREADDSIQSPAANAPGYGHIAFAVDDIHTAHRILLDRGARFVSEPVLVGSDTWFCFLHDPEGNIVELISRVAPGT
jgi:Predicted ring-cleavage extradiol dioxygenase